MADLAVVRDLLGRSSRHRRVDEPSALARLGDRTGLTRAGFVIVGLLVPVWLLGRLFGTRTLYLLVYGGILVVGIAKWLGRRRPSLTAERSELPTRVRQGQRFEVEIEMTATRRLGAFVIEERLHPHLGRVRRLPVAGLQRGEPVPFRYGVQARLRGVYTVGPLVGVWTDPFGLTRRTAELLPAQEVIVHPSTEPVQDRPLTRQWEDPPVRPPFSKPWPSGFEFYGMRDYVIGDDLRRVVWNAVARTGKMMVRESEQGITDKVRLIIDTDQRWHSPGSPSDTFEAAVKTVASLATQHLRDGFAVTIEAEEPIVKRLRTASRQIELLDALARLDFASTPLHTVLEKIAVGGHEDAHTLVVTPHLDGAAAARLKLLLDRNESVVLVLLVWEETDVQMLASASALGCTVIQLRPLTPLGAVFAPEVGAGRR